MARPCTDCPPMRKQKLTASIHGKQAIFEGWGHEYQDGSRGGMSPIGRARERFNASPEGRAYNAVTASLAAGEVACQVQSPVCTGLAQHQDEALPRGRAGGIAAALRDGPTPTLSCDPCNSFLAENLVWAAENGFARLKPPASSLSALPKDNTK